MPLTMAASVVLEHLPQDAHRALATAGEVEVAKGTISYILSSHISLTILFSLIQISAFLPPSLSSLPQLLPRAKPHGQVINLLILTLQVTIRLSPLPNTPQLKQPRFKCSSAQRFETIVRFLRRKLGLQEHESVFCYVNSVFAPGLDEGVGNLWRVRAFLLLTALPLLRFRERWGSFPTRFSFLVGEVNADFSLGQCFKTGDELVVSYSVTQAFG